MIDSTARWEPQWRLPPGMWKYTDNQTNITDTLTCQVGAPMKADVVVVKVEPGDVVEAGQVGLYSYLNKLFGFFLLQKVFWRNCDTIVRWWPFSQPWRWRWLCRLRWVGRWEYLRFHQITRNVIWSKIRNPIWWDIRILWVFYQSLYAKHFYGQVKATHVVVGDKVDAEDLLVELE